MVAPAFYVQRLQQKTYSVDFIQSSYKVWIVAHKGQMSSGLFQHLSHPSQHQIICLMALAPVEAQRGAAQERQ